MPKLQALYQVSKADKVEGKSKLGDNFIYIDCTLSWTMDFIDKLTEKFYLPPEIIGVGIGFLDVGNDHVKRFLSTGIKNDIEWIWINYIPLDKYEEEYRLGIDEYMDSVLTALPKAQKWVGLNYFKMTSKQISDLLVASRNATEKVDFDNCSIKIDAELDLGTEEYKISKLGMEDSFIKGKKGRDIGMMHILKAIAASPLKSSLKEISRSDCNVKLEIVEKYLHDVGMEHVKVLT